jgi:hypothetical protein
VRWPEAIPLLETYFRTEVAEPLSLIVQWDNVNLEKDQKFAESGQAIPWVRHEVAMVQPSTVETNGTQVHLRVLGIVQVHSFTDMDNGQSGAIEQAQYIVDRYRGESTIPGISWGFLPSWFTPRGVTGGHWRFKIEAPFYFDEVAG